MKESARYMKATGKPLTGLTRLILKGLRRLTAID
jgi:hypothetical protein